MHRKALIASLAVWIEQNLENDIAYENVVKKSGYSQWYLLWLFKKETGHSLRDYILSRRLSLCATALAEDTALKIGAYPNGSVSARRSIFVALLIIATGVLPLNTEGRDGVPASNVTSPK